MAFEDMKNLLNGIVVSLRSFVEHAPSRGDGPHINTLGGTRLYDSFPGKGATWGGLCLHSGLLPYQLQARRQGRGFREAHLGSWTTIAACDLLQGSTELLLRVPAYYN